MDTWTKVEIIGDVDGGRPRLQFCSETERFHVWLERESLQPLRNGKVSATLYANALDGKAETRVLKADSQRWAPVVNGLLSRFDLVAERARLVSEAAERRIRADEERAARERRARMCEHVEEMWQALTTISETIHHVGLGGPRPGDPFRHSANCPPCLAKAVLAKIEADA